MTHSERNENHVRMNLGFRNKTTSRRWLHSEFLKHESDRKRESFRWRQYAGESKASTNYILSSSWLTTTHQWWIHDLYFVLLYYSICLNGTRFDNRSKYVSLCFPTFGEVKDITIWRGWNSTFSQTGGHTHHFAWLRKPPTFQSSFTVVPYP